MLWFFDSINIITHGKSLKILFEIIDFNFKGYNKQFETVRKYGTRLINDEKQRSVTFLKSSLKMLWNIHWKTVF